MKIYFYIKFNTVNVANLLETQAPNKSMTPVNLGMMVGLM